MHGPLVLGTHNRKKGLELAELVAPLGIEVRTLADYPDAFTVVEDGDSFAANAQKKAAQQAVHLRAWVLGEDSGLVVDAFDGAPGIYSAGSPVLRRPMTKKPWRLLADLATLPAHGARRHYVCHATLANPAGDVVAEAEDTWRDTS